ncbi:MAG: hypothetical protein FIA95_12715 [Gemmatimonadetes bacterium]|nr:hypothetical protein [Gemmatimonadota bacterium]
MIAETERRRGVLDDSAATLRQVRGALAELGSEMGAADRRLDKVVSEVQGRGASLKDLVEILTTTYGEILNVIGSLRRSRGLLEQAAMERLKSTHQKLAEVSSATEMAATGMLAGLDRALVLVDRMESAAGQPGDHPDGAALRRELRDERHTLITLLQFQDITAQQLGYAGGVLLDIEDRMVELARVFDLRGVGASGEDERTPDNQVDLRSETCDPAASHFDADGRQALADEIFR